MTSAKKFDQNKPDLTHLSLETEVLMGRVREFGARKYSRGNWKNGFKITRSLAAALRHIRQFLDGRTYDNESGLLELGHAMCALEHAIYDFIHHPENDDRDEKSRTGDMIHLIDEAIYNPDAISPEYRLKAGE